jgi:hypothetical protein
MRSMSAPLADKRGYMNMLEIGDFEYVDPFDKMAEIYINQGAWMEVNAQRVQHGEDGFNDTEAREVGCKRGYIDFVDHLVEAGAIEIPDPLRKILFLKKKDRQQSCINQLRLTTSLVMAFIYDVCKTHDFAYSMYSGRVLPQGLKWEDMPQMAYLEEDGTVSVFGKTPLTTGQLKAAIEQQKTVIAKFIDKGPNWHCFVYTMKGVTGKEIGQGPHIHYLSNAWGIKRDKVVSDIKAGKYPYTGNHIPYQRYF